MLVQNNRAVICLHLPICLRLVVQVHWYFVFEHTCAYAWWDHMHRFLYVCLCLDQNSDWPKSHILGSVWFRITRVCNLESATYKSGASLQVVAICRSETLRLRAIGRWAHFKVKLLNLVNRTARAGIWDQLIDSPEVLKRANAPVIVESNVNHSEYLYWENQYFDICTCMYLKKTLISCL